MLRSRILYLLVAVLIQCAAAQEYRCSEGEEECVFPFTYKGVEYNECATKWTGSRWCYTSGDMDEWEYCKVCEAPSTTTSTTTASTTTTPTTTLTTKASTTSTSTVSTTTTPTMTSTSTASTTTTPTTTSTTTVSTTTAPTTASSTTTSSTTPTTMTSTTTTSTPTTTSQSTISTTTRPTTTKKKFSHTIRWKTTTSLTTPPATTSSTTITTTTPPTSNSTASTTTSPTTTSTRTTSSSTLAAAKVCTDSGKPCQFPFEYKGKTYTECARGFTYDWCYTDASVGEYSPCITCPKTTTTTAAGSTTSTDSSSSVKGTKSPNVPGILSKIDGFTTITSVVPTIRGSTIDMPALTSIPNMNVERKDAAESAPHTNDDQEGDVPPGDSTTKTVAIVVAVLSASAALVILSMIAVCIRKRRNQGKGDSSKNGNAGESGEGLLPHNENGNHKQSINDGDSQEMQRLNPKPKEEDAMDGAGGDCEVINEKTDDITANVKV